MAASQVRCQSSTEGRSDEEGSAKRLAGTRATAAAVCAAAETKRLRLGLDAEGMEGAREAALGESQVSGQTLVRGVAVFLGRGGEEDGGNEDHGDEGNDKERGREDVHGRNSL